MRFNVQIELDEDSLERKLEKMVMTGEDVTKNNTSPLIYTPKADGVGAAYNIRTDRFEEANKALQRASESKKRQRINEALKAEEKALENAEPKVEPKVEQRTE